MALTQRLEFRQSQSLVMTPQLMQAIKLLQLSNLDLAAFVEEELERNPLLERASDAPRPRCGRAGARAGRSSSRSRSGLRRCQPANDGEPGSAADGVRAGPGRMDKSRSRQPHRDRADPRHRPRQCLSRRAGRGRRARPRRTPHRPPIPNGAAAPPNDDDYNLEAFVAAEITLGGHLAEQLAVAFTGAGAAHDRTVSDRSGRRGRLSAGGSRPGRRAARRVTREMSRRFSRCCRNSTRPASARAI